MNIKINNKGQIMVITLLVLTIITIIVVSVILIASKDVEQQTITKQYEANLDKAENTIINTINGFSIPDYPLSSLVSDPTIVGENATCSLLGKTVTCNEVDTDSSTKITLEVTDTKNVEAFTLAKDGTFTMDLGNYKGLLRINWTGQTAMSFTLAYKRGNEYRSITDVFDTLNILSQHGNNPLNDIPPENHALAFRPYLSNLSTSTEILLSDTTGILATDELVNLTFKPIILDENGYTDLSVMATGALGDQMRVYRATAYADDVQNFGNTPAPTVISQIPLYPQVPSITDYVFLTNKDVDKNASTADALLPKPSTCGNRKVDSGEECDDGNSNNTDSCTTCCLTNTTMSVTVDGKTSVCSAGGTMPATNASCGPIESFGYDVPATAVRVPAGSEYFEVTKSSGKVSPNAYCANPTYSPDGDKNNSSSVITCSGRNISGLQTWRMALSAVFLNSNSVPANSAPQMLTYQNNDHNTLSLVKPAIQQSFAVGDGKGSSNKAQKFYVPGGARYLYFGFFESSNFQTGEAKCYGDNCNTESLTIKFFRTKCG